mmetsp:Transcript_30127/g.44044  ORF Transcript_30127/g.44044 Transcript_30127/m.44044 type:complete len:201 (-) Transcript_30127:62-664(-)
MKRRKANKRQKFPGEKARHPSSSPGYGRKKGRWSGCGPQPQLKKTQACICGRHQAPVLLEIPVELHPLVVRSSSVQPFLSSLYTPFTIMLFKWWEGLLEVLQALPQTEQTNLTCNLRVRKKPQACNYTMPMPLSPSQVLSSLQPGAEQHIMKPGRVFNLSTCRHPLPLIVTFCIGGYQMCDTMCVLVLEYFLKTQTVSIK